MQKTLELKAKPRTETNTRSARRIRGSGNVPAILYGGALPDGQPNREVKLLTTHEPAEGLQRSRRGYRRGRRPPIRARQTPELARDPRRGAARRDPSPGGAR